MQHQVWTAPLTWVAVLALLTVGLAGCIGTDGDEALDSYALDRPGEAPGGRVLSEGTSEASSSASGPLGGTGAIRGWFDVEPGAGAVFLHYVVDASGTDARGAVTLTSPDGDAYPMASWTGPTTIEQWMVLPAEAGEWTYEGTHQGELTTWVHHVVRARAPAGPFEAVGASGKDRPVVAIIDTGVNPYHEVFQRPALTTAALPARIAEVDTGLSSVSVPLVRSDDYLDSIAASSSLLAQLPAQRLVHFEGTNLLGYHVDETELPLLPVIDRAGHGTAVAHAVVREDPDALVVLVTGRNYDAGVAWAARQPWIDIISMSWGPATNLNGALDRETGSFTTWEPTRQAWANGKLVFGASGNDPTPTFTDTTTGPPWVHAVSGVEADVHGRAVLSGNLVDTVANWTQELADHDTLDGTHTTSGTSFATPTTAGIASSIVGQLRLRTAHQGGLGQGALVDNGDVRFTNADVRHALNRSAVWWATTDYGGPGSSLPAAPITTPPWVSMGWGYLDGRTVVTAVDGLLGDQGLPDKPAEAEAWMEANLDVRRTWWTGS